MSNLLCHWLQVAVQRRTINKPEAIVDNQDRYLHHYTLDRSVFSKRLKKRFSKSFLLRAITLSNSSPPCDRYSGHLYGLNASIGDINPVLPASDAFVSALVYFCT